MAWYGKRKKPTAKENKARIITCEHCGYEHNVMDGGWVANGAGVLLCHNERRDCLGERNKMSSLRSDSDRDRKESNELQGQVGLFE